MKKMTFIVAFLALFLAVCFLCSFAFHTVLEKRQGALSALNESEGPVIVIDAGHGGRDGGSVGVSGVLEKDLNLSVSRQLADLFRAAGYTVVETRTDDRMLGNAQRHKKQADLDARLGIVESIPNSILVSIHMNTYQGGGCRGLQVWYSPNNEASAGLAEAVQTAAKTLQPDNHRKIKAAGSSIYLLHRTKSPAILVECGFLSDETDCQLLSNPRYQRQLALTIFSALSGKIAPHT